MNLIEIKNEDGTTLEDMPKNPLEEKWDKLYPKKDICKKMERQNIINYSCFNCNQCKEGELFVIPKEDQKKYEEYLKKVDEYNRLHNPTLYKVCNEIKIRRFHSKLDYFEKYQEDDKKLNYSKTPNKH